MNECTHTLDYQLIDEGQKTTKEGQLKRTYDFMSCECIDQHVERVQHISSGQSMRKGRTGRVTFYEWRTPQEYSDCDLLVQITST